MFWNRKSDYPNYNQRKGKKWQKTLGSSHEGSHCLGLYSKGLKNPVDAMKSYRLALKHHAKYAPAYAALAKISYKNGNQEEARKILRQGLQAAPKSRQLKRALERLDKK